MTYNRTTTGIGATALAVGVFLFPDHAFAVGQGLPWEFPLSRIQLSLSGPVFTSMAVIAIVIACFAYAFGEGGSLMRRSSGMVVGLSIGAIAIDFVGDLFGLGAGMAF